MKNMWDEWGIRGAYSRMGEVLGHRGAAMTRGESLVWNRAHDAVMLRLSAARHGLLDETEEWEFPITRHDLVSGLRRRIASGVYELDMDVKIEVCLERILEDL